MGVANVGLDDNWFGNHLSQANLYGFGRLAWNPDLTARADRRRVDAPHLRRRSRRCCETVDAIQLSSWRTYENYTGPLGLQTLTDITGNHFGVNVEASERNGWGQWHRADEKGVGMDRTVATGTGFIGQYRPPVAQMLRIAGDLSRRSAAVHASRSVHVHAALGQDRDSVPSTIRTTKAPTPRRDTCANGRALKGLVDEHRYREVLAQLEYQAGQAVVWRDAVTDWFRRASGIADAKGRVGRHPGRFEAEAMKLDGYAILDVTPWEGASGGKAVSCAAARCTASFRFEGAPGWYTIRVQYFDQTTASRAFRSGRQPAHR